MQRQQHSGDIEHCLVKSKAVTQSRDDPKKEKSQGSQNGGRWLNLYLLDSVFCLFSSFCHLLPPTGCSIQSALLVVSILKRAENEKIPGISSHCPIVNQKLFQRHPHSVLFLLPPLLPPDFFFPSCRTGRFIQPGNFLLDTLQLTFFISSSSTWPSLLHRSRG